MSLEAIEAELKAVRGRGAQAPRPTRRDREAVVRRGPAHVHARPARAHDDPRVRPDDGARPVHPGALRGIGYKVLALDVPDNDALQYGREYGNRGQCNPTYFTVGNLVKYLDGLREQGMAKDDIVKNHVFITAGACGPCRFGTYVTEYRKALRDSGFDGFRVLLFQQTGGLKQATGEGVGLEMNPTFFWAVVRAIMVGDALNALGYRIRPYEVEPGATDRALETSKRIISQAFEHNTSLAVALYKVRRELGNGRGRPHARQAARRHHRRVLGDDDRGRRQLRPAALPRGRGRRAGHPARHGVAALHDLAGPLRHRSSARRCAASTPTRASRRQQVQPRRASTSASAWRRCGPARRCCAACSRPSRTRSASTTTTCRT